MTYHTIVTVLMLIFPFYDNNCVAFIRTLFLISSITDHVVCSVYSLLILRGRYAAQVPLVTRYCWLQQGNY